MSGRKIDEKTISIPEVKNIMEEVKKKIKKIDEEDEMSHFQEITYNYVNQFAKMDQKTAIKLKKFLMNEPYNLEEIYAINIVNIDPQNVPELRVLLEKSAMGRSLNDDQLQELLYQISEIKTA